MLRAPVNFERRAAQETKVEEAAVDDALLSNVECLDICGGRRLKFQKSRITLPEEMLSCAGGLDARGEDFERVVLRQIEPRRALCLAALAVAIEDGGRRREMNPSPLPLGYRRGHPARVAVVVVIACSMKALLKGARSVAPGQCQLA
ncbi:MAG: hypothetical protein QOF02_2264 [Blastocatellia bacterium]|nr:hypothetical protein [Blastocatellia bacterium]